MASGSPMFKQRRPGEHRPEYSRLRSSEVLDVPFGLGKRSKSRLILRPVRVVQNQGATGPQPLDTPAKTINSTPAIHDDEVEAFTWAHSNRLDIGVRCPIEGEKLDVLLGFESLGNQPQPDWIRLGGPHPTAASCEEDGGGAATPLEDRQAGLNSCCEMTGRCEGEPCQIEVDHVGAK